MRTSRLPRDTGLASQATKRQAEPTMMQDNPYSRTRIHLDNSSW